MFDMPQQMLDAQRALNIKQSNFEELEQTSEYQETNYYKKLADSPKDISLNRFWAQLASYYVTGVSEQAQKPNSKQNKAGAEGEQQPVTSSA